MKQMFLWAIWYKILEEIMIKHNKELMAIKTYFQVTTQLGNGLDYCGVTLIPTSSLK